LRCRGFGYILWTLSSQCGGFYKEMELIVTSAVGCQIGDDGHGFRRVDVSKTGKITHDY
ncbi:Metallophosphoesterase CSTP1, partial [Caligus rogercresseyi]